MSCFLFGLILRQTGSFSVTDPFLTTFYYVEKLNGILRKNSGEGVWKILRTITWGVKNCQNHPYVINEWPLILSWWRYLEKNVSFPSPWRVCFTSDRDTALQSWDVLVIWRFHCYGLRTARDVTRVLSSVSANSNQECRKLCDKNDYISLQVPSFIKMYCLTEDC